MDDYPVLVFLIVACATGLLILWRAAGFRTQIVGLNRDADRYAALARRIAAAYDEQNKRGGNCC